MNNFYLKLIALSSMLIDHISFILIPYEEYFILRVIGRIAFPIFAFLISEGCYYTKNIKKYLFRLFIFSVFIEIIFKLFIKKYNNQYIFETLNIFFTLFFGVLTVYLDKVFCNKIALFIYFFTIIILSEILKFDYGFFGILLIYTFYKIKIYNKDIKIRKLKQSIVILIFSFLFHAPINIYEKQLFLGFCFSIIPIILYNEKLGHKFKFLFYIFYPVHFIILVIIKYFLIYYKERN